MFKKQTTGSIVCPSCGQLISVNNTRCPHCGYKNPSLWGYGKAFRKLEQDLGFTKIIIWGCITFYVITLLFDIKGIQSPDAMNLLSPSGKSLFVFGATGAIPIFDFGRWWSIFTSGWLHGSLIHIAFNLVWIKTLAPVVNKAYGVGRLIIIYTISDITSSLLTSIVAQYFNHIFPPILGGAEFSIGASGGVFGLFGALVAYGQITSSMRIQQKYWSYFLVLFIIGLIFPGTDNWGHLGGFVGGYLICLLPWFDPRKREAEIHLLVGLACIGITFLSIIISVIHGLQFL